MKRVAKLKGKSIFLGPLHKDDLELITQWINDLEAHKFTSQSGVLFRYEDEEAWFEKNKASTTNKRFGIYLNKSSTIIGICGLRDINSIHRTANLGISIGDKTQWNKGYGSQAIKLLIQFGFEIVNLHNILLHVVDYNQRAQHVYEKCGFKVIGRRRKSHYFNGTYHDEIYMDITRDDIK